MIFDSFEIRGKKLITASVFTRGALNKPWVKLSADCIIPQNAAGVEVGLNGYSINLNPYWVVRT